MTLLRPDHFHSDLRIPDRNTLGSPGVLHCVLLRPGSFDRNADYCAVPIALIGVLFGPLIDRFGIKRLYLLAIGIGAAATLAFAATPGWWPKTRIRRRDLDRPRLKRPDGLCQLHRVGDERVMVAGCGDAVRDLHVAFESELLPWCGRVRPGCRSA